jgi:hypothetical protein
MANFEKISRVKEELLLDYNNPGTTMVRTEKKIFRSTFRPTILKDQILHYQETAGP